MSARENPHFKLRVTPELKAWIERQAKMNHRSLTGEIAYHLEMVRKNAEGEVRPQDGTPAAGQV